MINSIGSNQAYWSTRVSNIMTESPSTDSSSQDTSNDTVDAVQSVETNTSRTSTESYSLEDHMKMMQGNRPMGPPPSPPSENVSFSEIDSDSNGSLSENEYEDLLSIIDDENAISTKDFFSAYDTNNDGEITSDELEATLTSETNSMRPMGPPPPPPPSENVLFSEIDSDSDGSLSEDEYEDLLSIIDDENAVSTKDFFSAYDTNNDGEITSDELEATLTSETNSMRPMGPPPPPNSENLSSIESNSTEDDDEISSVENTHNSQNNMSNLILNAIKTYQMNNINSYETEQNSIFNSLT